MKTLLHAYAMCQSMFCAIPCPWKIWDEKAKGKMLLFLPIVGLEIGAIWAGLAWLCSFLKLPALVVGLILCAKSGVFDVLALVLPLLFVRPVITLAEFFRKKGA